MDSRTGYKLKLLRTKYGLTKKRLSKSLKQECFSNIKLWARKKKFK